MWSPYEGLNNLISLLNHSTNEVRIGAMLGVGLTCNGIMNVNEDLPLNVLDVVLSFDIKESSPDTMNDSYSAALLSLALSYANTAREDLIPYLLKAIQHGNSTVAGVAAIASGLIFCGRRPEALVIPLLERLAKITEEVETQLGYLLMGFGLSMLYFV